MAEPKWEILSHFDNRRVERLSVPAGWLYMVKDYFADARSPAMLTFAPDDAAAEQLGILREILTELREIRADLDAIERGR